MNKETKAHNLLRYFRSFIVILVIFILMLSGCDRKEQRRVSLKGQVLEVKEQYILIEPLEEESLSADKITVSTQVKDSQKVPDLKEGDCVKILYDGIILESYQAKINQVYEIQLLSEGEADTE